MDEPAQPPAPHPEEGRYRLLVEAVTDYAIYMLDAQGRISSWNAGAQRFKGYAADEVMGQHFSRFYTEADQQAGLAERALATAATEGRFEGEGWRVRKDGGRFWAHVVIDPIRSPTGELLGFAKVTRDLTERRAAQAQLQRSEQQFRLLVQAVSDYAIFMLDEGGFVTSWNAGAQRIKGWAEAEIVGQHFSVFYPLDDQARGLPEQALAVAAFQGRFEAEGWRVRKDGSPFWANVVMDAIRNEEGELIGFAKVTRDVTTRRQAQHELEQAREALFQAQKLDAIGQLTGGVAHDFNNLLMVILSSLEMMRRRAGEDARMHTLIENAVKGARRGASLTQRMLSFARRQDLQPAVVDVMELVTGMTDLLSRSLGPQVALRLPRTEGLRPVFVDPHQLELALLNLAVNARDAMPSGGAITLQAHMETVAPGAGTLAPGEYVRLSVQDDGEGMDPATLARATEPFFTTKGVGKGTGLGLSMVEGLAVQSHGRFTLSSQPGQGTTAELWLPAVAEAPAALGPHAAELPAPALQPPRRVLVVDDDNLVLNNTVAMLEELGHLPVPAESAEQALTILRQDAGIELLLTDHAMPQMTGAQLLARARQERPQLPLILATGYAEPSIELPALAQRLGKPFGIDALARAIHAAQKGAATG